MAVLSYMVHFFLRADYHFVKIKIVNIHFNIFRAVGISANYIFINLTGYTFYTVYNLYGYFHGENVETGKVNDSDLLFALHSVFAYCITSSLFFYYPHNIKINTMTKFYLLIQWALFIYFGIQFIYEPKPI